jgi:hypothetical protein
MTYRSVKYFTRPALIAADQERTAAGIPDRHAHPPYRKLPRAHRFVVVVAYPFLNGFGDGVPQVRAVLQWAEGGLQWTVDMTLARYRSLPKMTVDDPDVYRLA